jgi:hypothetical protein
MRISTIIASRNTTQLGGSAKAQRRFGGDGIFPPVSGQWVVAADVPNRPVDAAVIRSKSAQVRAVWRTFEREPGRELPDEVARAVRQVR